MPHMSRTQVKDAIFDHLAEHFEKTGITTSVSAHEIASTLDQKIGRVKSLIQEMVKEDVLYHDPELGEGRYRLTPNAYTQLVQGLASAGRLPSPQKDDDGNEVPWLNFFGPRDD